MSPNPNDWEEPFIQSKKCYEVIRKHGKQVIVMEPVKGSTLARVPMGAEHILKELDKNASPASYAIRFAASRAGVLVVLSGMSNLSQVEENTGFMRDLKPLTEAEERALKEVKAEFQKTWKYQCDNWSALDDNAYGVPISGIIRAYNSMLIQPDPFFAAELNYYKSFRSAYDLAFETGDHSKETAKIGGAFDVTAALKEAVKTQFENSFQAYMDQRKGFPHQSKPKTARRSFLAVFVTCPKVCPEIGSRSFLAPYGIPPLRAVSLFMTNAELRVFYSSLFGRI